MNRLEALLDKNELSSQEQDEKRKLEEELDNISLETAEKEEIRKQQEELNKLIDQLTEFNKKHFQDKFIKNIHIMLQKFKDSNEGSKYKTLNSEISQYDLKPIDLIILKSITDAGHSSLSDINDMLNGLGLSKDSNIVRLLGKYNSSKQFNKFLSTIMPEV